MSDSKKYSLGILATHPIQYYVPWYQALAGHPEIDLRVFYCHRLTPQEQAQAGFGVSFDWDIPLLKGYKYQFLNNKVGHPNVSKFFGCDTPEIKRIIYESSFDAFIVHGWNVLSFWQAIFACWKTHTPILVRGDSQLLTQRSLIKRLIKYPFFRWFIPRFDAYLIVGKRAKEYYLHYGADEKKMFFVPHSVDNDFFASARAALESERGNLRQARGIPKDAFVFLFVGKIISRKRPYDFLKALELAHKNSSQIFGLVVGDGPLRAKLEILSRRLNLPVKFTGFLNQTDMPKAYVVSDALVLPSDGRETWGLVIDEAMASGLPAIVSDKVGCGPDLIYPHTKDFGVGVYPGKTGEVFRYGNTRRLSEIIIEFVSNPRHLKEMGENARQLIANYSVNNTLKGTLAAIHTVV